MTVWKLTPIDLNHRDWEASTHRKEVIVRAESEKNARQLATHAFFIATKKVTPGEKVRTNPWSQPTLVSATEVDDSNYPKTEQEEILDP